MAIRRASPSSATLTGGSIDAEISHTEDSITLGDETNKLVFTDQGGTKCIPVDVKATTGATSANQTNGSQKTQLVNGSDTAEFDDVGGEKALKVSIIATVGGGSGGTAATDSATFTATSTQFTPIGGVFDDASSDALAENEMGLVRMTSARAMHVQFQNTSLAVTGTFWQATQPVSGTFWQATQPVSGTFWQATQPVSNADITSSKTALELIDDTIFTDDAAFTAAVSKVQMMGGQYQSSPNALDDGDAGSVLLDSSHRQVVVVASAPTTAVTGTFWQATQPVSGTFWQATQPVSIASLPALAAGTNNIGDVDVLSLPALPAGSNNIGDVDVLTMPTVTVVGSAAHDNGSPGVPIMTAGRATSSETNVASGDVSYISTDLGGRTITQPFGPRERVAVQQTTITSSAAETTIITAIASTFNDITCLSITNSSSTGTIATLKDSTTGTTRGIWYIPATGGAIIPFPTPLPQATANNNWTLTTASVASIYVVAQYVKRA